MFSDLIVHAEANKEPQKTESKEGAEAQVIPSGETVAPKSSKDTSATAGTQETELESRNPLWWMVKPCHIYKEEYKDCKSIKERFNQYFIYGEMQECSHWNEDYKNCRLWEDSKDKEALDKLIESERQRVRLRLRNHYLNDVWENREKPPEDWNDPLPESISQGYENSYLKQMRDELKKLEENPDAPVAPNTKAEPKESSCVVM